MATEETKIPCIPWAEVVDIVQKRIHDLGELPPADFYQRLEEILWLRDQMLKKIIKVESTIVNYAIEARDKGK
jgi:hypothetical protein